MRVRRLAWLLLIAVVAVPAAGDDPAVRDRDTLRAVYDYDASAPLDAKVLSVQEMGLFSVEEIRFSGAGGERVPATLMRPASVENPPCVLFLHGLGGDKSQARVAAMVLIPQGVAVFAIDAALHGERSRPGESFAEMGQEIAAIDGPLVRTVVDNRRAIDYIETRADIDADGMVLIGASMGGILGSIVSAVDERIHATALLVAGGAWPEILAASEHPLAERLRAAGLDEGRAFAHVEPVNFVGDISPRPLLMINGSDYRIIPPASAEALYNAAGEPKQIRWYDGGHVEIRPAEVLFLAGWVGEQVRGDGSAGPGAAETDQ